MLRAIFSIILFLTVFAVTAQFRLDLSRSLERFEVLGSPVDSGFIVSDAQGRADWQTINDTKAMLGVGSSQILYSDEERIVGIYDMGATVKPVYERSYEINDMTQDFQTSYKNPTESGLRVLEAVFTWYYDDLNGNSTGSTNMEMTPVGRWYWSGTLGDEYLYFEVTDIGELIHSGLNSNLLLTIRFIR